MSHVQCCGLGTLSGFLIESTALSVMSSRCLTEFKGLTDVVRRPVVDYGVWMLHSGPDFAEGDMARRLTHTTKLVEVLHNDQVRCCLVDRKHVLSSHSFAATDVVPAESDAEAEAAVIKRMQASCPSKFVWTQFQELGRFYFQR